MAFVLLPIVQFWPKIQETEEKYNAPSAMQIKSSAGKMIKRHEEVK